MLFMREIDLVIPVKDQQPAIVTFTDALDRYVGYRSLSLSDGLSLYGDQIANRLRSSRDDAGNHIDIVIPTYI